MTDFWKNSNNILRLIISILAATAMLVHLAKWGNVQFDNYSLILLAIAVLPWLSAFIESFSLGKDSFDIKLREVEKKADAAKDAALLGTGGKTLPSKAEIESLQKEGIVVDDPQKRRWGGKSSCNGRILTAAIEKIPGENFFRRVVLRVRSTDRTKPLSGKVTFHLHPTFKRSVLDVPVVEGVAEISLVAWGAFTIGAEADNGQTQLELDLANENGQSDDPFFKR
jgi:hypothetical protein